MLADTGCCGLRYANFKKGAVVCVVAECDGWADGEENPLAKGIKCTVVHNLRFTIEAIMTAIHTLWQFEPR